MWIVVPKVTMEVLSNLNRKSVGNNSPEEEDMRGEERRRTEKGKEKENSS